MKQKTKPHIKDARKHESLAWGKPHIKDTRKHESLAWGGGRHKPNNFFQP